MGDVVGEAAQGNEETTQLGSCLADAEVGESVKEGVEARGAAADEIDGWLPWEGDEGFPEPEGDPSGLVVGCRRLPLPVFVFSSSSACHSAQESSLGGTSDEG